MHVNYPKKYPQVHWDTLNLDYPVRLINTNQPILSSETIARKWRPQPETLQEKTQCRVNDNEYFRDYPTSQEFGLSQTSKDYRCKILEVLRHNKHTSSVQNKYIYPPSKSLEYRTPTCGAHGTTEMKESYKKPVNASRLVTDKDQFKHLASQESKDITEQCWPKELEPIDTTHEGYEKYLDPYLTTNRLHHRPYRTDQLNKISNSKDIVTYYTLADVPWVKKYISMEIEKENAGKFTVWSTKPKHDDHLLRLRGPKTMFDREKFKGDFREIRAHNKLQWVPGSFRTEVKDNFAEFQPPLVKNLEDYEVEVASAYQRSIGKLKTNIHYEDAYIRRNYSTESSQIGSKKPICSVFDQNVEKIND